MIKGKIPKAKIPEGDTKLPLPYNGNAVKEKGFSISFSCFDRSQEEFNLGGCSGDGTIGGKWFLDLLDCLKNVGRMTIPELKASMYDLHPIDWDKTNVGRPSDSEQLEYWQFRINKSRGRVIGFKLDNIFYVVWLDPHHNLTDSEGYGTVKTYKKPQSEYETLCEEVDFLKAENSQLKGDLELAYKMMGE